MEIVMEPIGYLMLGAVTAVALIGFVGYAFVRKLELRLEAKKF
jgi:hypothetical protein